MGLATGLVTLCSPRAHAQPPGKQTPQPLKIALHVGDADHWTAALSNIKNLVAQHPNAQLRVIADGSGVYMLQGQNDLSPLLQKYAALGVEFQACHNALNEKQIPLGSLPSFIQVVPAGVVALSEAQYAGYAYIKP
jgi:uncharacterized protein